MKQECSEFQKRIARYLLEDLAAEEKQPLEEHLAECPRCRSEKESYSQTLQLMKSVDSEPVPRHFFVHPEERKLNPWALFRLMKPHWQVAAAALAGLFLLTSAGWVMSLTRNNIDVAALKKDILNAAEEKNNQAKAVWFQEVQAEIARSNTDLTKQQKAEITAAMTRLDSRLTGRMAASENRMRDDTKDFAVSLYRTVAQDRAQDLRFINLRFDAIEANNAIETRRNDAIFGTLLQATELRLK
jgi:anti-sigma factor RsiW